MTPAPDKPPDPPAAPPPGPYSVETENGFVWVTAPNPDGGETLDLCELVDDAPGDAPPRPVTLATARLLAASWELLAACEAVSAAEWSELGTAVGQARAAAAKAKGGQP